MPWDSFIFLGNTNYNRETHRKYRNASNKRPLKLMPLLPLQTKNFNKRPLLLNSLFLGEAFNGAKYLSAHAHAKDVIAQMRE